MNVSIRLIAVRAGLLGMAVLLLSACGGEKTTEPTTETPSPSVPIPEPQTAYLTAVGGDVQFPDYVIAPEVGDPLRDNSVIDIGIESFVDVQFGDRSVVRVFGDGTASPVSRGGVPERPVLRLLMERGVIVVNVSYLAPSEVFRVETTRATYRVSGTRFVVSSREMDEVSVTEGKVDVLPPSLDMEMFLESEAASDDDVRDALFGLDNNLPRISAGETARVDSEAMEASDKLSEQLADKIRQIEAANTPARPSLVSELLTIIRETSDSVSNTVVRLGSPSAEVADKLAQIDEMALLPVSKDPHGLSLLESEDVVNLVKFTLRTVPQSSDIFVNDLWVGQSVYRAVLRASDSLSIRVTKEGYRERRLTIDRARSEVITVQLERLPPSISAESFIKAILADDLATVRTYVQEGGTVNVRTDDNIPAVVLASGLVPVLRGQAPDLSYHREILRTVVAAGADLEAPFVIEGSTFRLLHAAVLAGVAGFDVADLIELFTDAGADVNSTIVLEGEELTPLAVAVRWAMFTGETREDLMKLLVEAGSSLDVTINYDDELLTLREIAARLIRDGEVVDPALIRLLGEVPS